MPENFYITCCHGAGNTAIISFILNIALAWVEEGLFYAAFGGGAVL